MSKSTFFTGQPIFAQIIDLLYKSDIRNAARRLSADRYCKKFKTYDHLVVMLYTIFNRCTSLREVTTGIMACSSKLLHLGVDYTIRRSTLSDANKRRPHEVFEDIYRALYRRYAQGLPDSLSNSRLRKKLFIVDSTTIKLFQEILKAAGCRPVNGKKKGGIKAHTLMKADEDVPQLVRFTAGAANDTTFMKHITLPKGSILVFDRGYNDYKQLDRFTKEGITWVTRVRKQMVIQPLYEKEITPHHYNLGIRSDTVVCLGHDFHDKITKVHTRRIVYYDKINNYQFEFLSNNMDFSPLTIAQIYKQRWQIEVLFKRIKQNYPLKNFLGDNENAIKIQIWCALIADLLIKVVSSRTVKKWSFANLASMIRLHLMTYIHLVKFLNHPEKALLKISQQRSFQKSLFPT